MVMGTQNKFVLPHLAYLGRTKLERKESLEAEISSAYLLRGSQGCRNPPSKLTFEGGNFVPEKKK